MAYTIVDPPQEMKGKFEIVEQPSSDKISRALNIGVGSVASGIAGAPGALESYIRSPAVLTGKAMRFFGKEPPEILQQQENIIPDPATIYNHLEKIVPENMLERYLNSIASSASAGAVIGGAAGSLGAGVGAIPGAGIGAAAGGLYGAVSQSLSEMGVPPELLETLSLAIPILRPFAKSIKNKISTGKKATSLVKEAIGKAGEGQEVPFAGESFDVASNLKSELQKSQERTPVPQNLPEIPSNAGVGESLLGRASLQQIAEPGPEINIKPTSRITEGKKLGGRVNLAETPESPKSSYQFRLPETSYEAPTLKGRVERSSERLKKTSPEIEDKLSSVGRRISPTKFYNDFEAGHSISENAKIAWDSERNKNKLLYELAEKEIKGVEGPHNELIHQLKAARDKFKTKSPNPAEELVLKEINSLLSVLEDKDSGHAKNVSADALMKTANSLSYRVNYEELHSGPKDILRSVVHDINNSAIESVERAGKDSSAITKADKAFAKTAEKFNNDEIAPFLKSKIANQEDLFSIAKKPAVFRALKDSLQEFPSGRSSLSKLERSIVEDRMEVYIKDPNKIGSFEFENDIKNLESIIGKDKVEVLKNTMERKKEYSKEHPNKIEPSRVSYKQRPERMKLFEESRPKILEKQILTAEQQKKIEPSRISYKQRPERMKLFEDKLLEKETIKAKEKEAIRKFEEKNVSVIEKRAEKIVSKYSGKTPKEIESIFKQQGGPEELRSLKKEIEKKPSAKQYYYQLAAKRMHDIFYEGKVDRKLKAKNAFDIINEKENYSQIEELLGKEETRTLYKNLKENKNTEVTMSNIAKWSGTPILIKVVKGMFVPSP